ncbi:Fic family protein [Candidatus Palauibacter sp.]|uniref:Fic family protein n=1 Tax=Candidatus Palauibacter sp. TaxID=3101350 RepID=UPI003B018042
MKIPTSGPTLRELLSDQDLMSGIARTLTAGTGPEVKGRYYHWDKLRHLDPPAGLTTREWWLALKFARAQLAKPITLLDKTGTPFTFSMTDTVLQAIHRIDRDASGKIEISEQVTSPETRDRYIINSLIQEATTSSQLEGAVTTIERAKDMIRTGRKPTDQSEQMILNNYRAMRRVRQFARDRLTPERILELQKVVTADTLDDPDDAGRLRRREDDIVVSDFDGKILHRPPDANELEARLDRMCAFANGEDGDAFVHPVIRAIILHFWVGYDHPFVDGNGRTARALFYWSMLSQGYWLCEYISISTFLRSQPAKYARAYLHTETDENDLTYFVLHQLGIIQRAIEEVHVHLDRKMEEIRRVEALLRQAVVLNHRQLALLSHSLKHPNSRYSIRSHRSSHNVVYQTARTDLLDLAARGLLTRRNVGRTFYFFPQPDLADRLRSLEA